MVILYPMSNTLRGDWLTYYKVASKYVHKARYQDRDDLLHTIMVNLVVAGSNNGDKPDNPSWMYRIASFTVAQYWRDYYYHNNGIDCGHCSNQQRKKCKEQDLHTECPKAIKATNSLKAIADSKAYPIDLTIGSGMIIMADPDNKGQAELVAKPKKAKRSRAKEPVTA